MSARQRELKRKYLQEQRSSFTNPIIDCLECEHLELSQCEHGQRLYWCRHPRAITLRGVVLYRSSGAESLDLINAPKECMRRPPCSPGCQKHVLEPCERCGRAWSE